MSQWDIYKNYKTRCFIIGRTRYTIGEVSEQLNVPVSKILQLIHKSVNMDKHIFKQKEIMLDEECFSYIKRKLEPKKTNLNYLH